MTTTRDLIDRIRREFLGGTTEELNRLAADPATGTTLALSYDLRGISEGARLSCELEDFYVWQADPATKVATVQRGFESSIATAHNPGTIVRVAPKISDHQVLIALNNQIRGMYGEGIFTTDVATLHFTPGHSVYGLPVGALDVWRVHSRDPTEPDGWVRLNGWLFDRDQNTTDFASGVTMTFTREVPPSGFDFRVTYKKELGVLSNSDQVIEIVVGTPAIDLLALGTAIRLTRADETARNQTAAQGSTRRAAEVPAGAELGGNRWLMQAYQQEVFREKARLTKLYPPMSRM